ncbi:MAG: hypothetical protein FJZ47_03530 [Candidatus Tectomicrobia bacterium]|uniref:Protein kinase domain-containing protein n=1 Tax=Tectimicrobiota bacterium TaxID=2528274 RepID=A0A937W032_UNCTE|nr:hypothetical protein [Candidatus Tectomicrobia bacterium]
MEQVDLRRYDITGVLGLGADYEVRAAVDRDTGRQVVLKRPSPESVRHRIHDGIETRTERILQAYHEVGHRIPTVTPIVGYTERDNHDAYFGESLGQSYRVIVEERANGIPLMSDLKARFRGIPIGVGQNLFTLFPLGELAHTVPFAVQQQLLDLEEAFFQAGYLLLDLRPHNVFYQPASGRITVIDCGALADAHGVAGPRGPRPPEIHDFYLEMLKFYTTPQPLPLQSSGYRDPYGIRPVVHFERELEQMAQQFRGVTHALVREAALSMIERVRQRAYTSFQAFREDLTAYLAAVREMHNTAPDYAEARQAWQEALDWLRTDYWQRYLFQPATELAGFIA